MQPSILYEETVDKMKAGGFEKAKEESLSVCWETLVWGKKRNSTRPFQDPDLEARGALQILTLI